MKKYSPFLVPLLLLFFIACNNGSPADKAETQKAAAEEKEAVMLDSISNALEKEKAEIDSSVQKLEEGLKDIEQ